QEHPSLTAPCPLSPDELELVEPEGESRIRARQSLPAGLRWGPYCGNIHGEPASPEQNETNPPVTLILGDEHCWLSRLPLVSTEAEANAVIYRKDEGIWCKTTQAVREGEPLSAIVMTEPQAIPNHVVKPEPGDVPYPATLHSDIQLLPQQAGMAAILATAVVNKDVFPCKDCGIWYRSERNLQAHLMYYCASRQSSASPAADEKPKETYPNERVCPFPQCKKSCPSASSLEIHMRSHSGERPFVCLICLSAFTTKANCERHLKVHTDTLNGVCHSCGFISTTRDILYSHLVTNHMICQPGSKGEVYSPGPGLPAAKPLAPDGLVGLQQHVARHGPLPAGLGGAEPRAAQPPPCPGSPARAPADETPNGEARTPHGEGTSSSSSCSSTSSEAVPPIRVKEEPLDSPEGAKGDASPGLDPDASSRASSPRSLPSAKVKSELASPTPGSSPVPSEPAAGGTVFLPQYVFGHEAAVVPQASEILAKMSELVHSRLKQGQGAAGPAGLFPGAPVPKGATCFECEITFNNINNYYVHKRLYCSSRHLAEDSPPGARKPKALPPPAPKGPALLSPPPPDSLPAPEGDAERGATPPVPAPEAKVEEGSGGSAKAGGSPEADGAGRASEGSPSPSSSVDEAEEDPSRTLCEACNIRFSRHETYVVHKRFYCASRHDPPLRRPSAAKGPFLPQPVRTRKRRKLYEIHGAPSPPAASANGSPLPAGSPSAPLTLSPVPEALRDAGLQPPTPPGYTDKSVQTPPAKALPGPVPNGNHRYCRLCNIKFSSLSTFIAHKKYYCSSHAAEHVK
uniref:Zinc finger protein ZFPM1 n=1 Tax=Crocodylus porosus TaxID=8502 RepID=A0A7M4EH06_CROPO